MKIDHVSIYTDKLEPLKLFYEKYFGAVSNEKYHNKNTGLETYFLSFEDGARLELMMRSDLTSRAEGAAHMGYIHLAFHVDGKEGVDALTEKLKQAGFIVLSGPRTTGDGYYESCILDPDGNQIEIVG